MGTACSFSVLEVSTSSSVEKKVERSGRRGRCEVDVGGLVMLCSTFERLADRDDRAWS